MYKRQWRAAATIVLVGMVVCSLLIAFSTFRGTGAASTCLTNGSPSGALAAPSNLYAYADVDNGEIIIVLSWDDNSDNESCFVIESKDGVEGTYSQIGIVSAGTTECIDDGPFNTAGVTYRIFAANAAARSDYSEEYGTVIPQSANAPGRADIAANAAGNVCNNLITASPTPTLTIPHSPTVSPGPTPTMLGDLTCDGRVDTADVLRMLSYLAQIINDLTC